MQAQGLGGGSRRPGRAGGESGHLRPADVSSWTPAHTVHLEGSQGGGALPRGQEVGEPPIHWHLPCARWVSGTVPVPPVMTLRASLPQPPGEGWAGRGQTFWCPLLGLSCVWGACPSPLHPGLSPTALRPAAPAPPAPCHTRSLRPLPIMPPTCLSLSLSSPSPVILPLLGCDRAVSPPLRPVLWSVPCSWPPTAPQKAPAFSCPCPPAWHINAHPFGRLTCLKSSSLSRSRPTCAHPWELHLPHPLSCLPRPSLSLGSSPPRATSSRGSRSLGLKCPWGLSLVGPRRLVPGLWAQALSPRALAASRVGRQGPGWEQDRAQEGDGAGG